MIDKYEIDYLPPTRGLFYLLLPTQCELESLRVGGGFCPHFSPPLSSDSLFTRFALESISFPVHPSEVGSLPNHYAYCFPFDYRLVPGIFSLLKIGDQLEEGGGWQLSPRPFIPTQAPILPQLAVFTFDIRLAVSHDFSIV